MSKIANLHILRALATMVVVFAHAILRTDRWAQFPTTALTVVESLGWMAVDTFFVISGFIMIYTSSSLFGSRAGAAEFARRRLIRIVPLYWLATAVEVALRARHSGAPSLSKLVHSLLFLPQVTEPGQALRPIVGVGWTLNYEALFYVMFGLAVFLPRRIGIGGLFVALVALVAAGWFVRPPTDVAVPTTVAAFLTDRIILMFGVGVVIGLIYGPNGPPIANRLRHPFAVVLALTLASITIVLTSSDGPHPSLIWEIPLRVAVTAVVVVCLFGTPSTRAGSTQTLSLLGDASYSIYLFHFILIVAVEKIWLTAIGAHGAATCVLVLVVAAHVGGIAIYLAIERPVTRYLQALTKTRRASRGSAVPVAPEAAS
ncbi:acyltransferase family protein [Methylobacterium trifolii]|uniref:O-acetyltransferase OatA n=1 Tax=Methylobacterium trifolii TaxID=1003092 RepID=A0ABQ4U290_9HYPH|nr:acyltransferase [Methylobacterium trifolii]GJE60972.1 O-acetyltransferase OatA [Methylobacterium trifolii]